MPSVCAPGIVGAGIKVPVSGGRFVPYANLDYAASAPCLAAVQHAVAEALPTLQKIAKIWKSGFTPSIPTFIRSIFRKASSICSLWTTSNSCRAAAAALKIAPRRFRRSRVV